MIPTDTAAMHRVAVAAFPELAGRDVVVHDDGWDSVALEVGAAWICKYPRDADGVGALRREARLLAAIRPQLTMAVPTMEFVEYPVPFTRHRLLPGVGLLSDGYARLDAAQRQRLAGDVGGFLAELHAIDADWTATGIGAEDEAADPDAIVGVAMPLLPPELRPAAERTIVAYAALGDDPLGHGLCYLDAHGRNFTFDPVAGRLNGIFDSATPASRRGTRSSSSPPMCRATSRSA